MHGANLKRSGRGLAPLMVVALFAAGCGGSDAEQAEEAGGPVTVTVGTLPTANAAAMYLGIEQGFFEEEDLALEAAVVGSGNEIITGLVSGDYQFGFVGYVSAGIAAANNVPVCVVAANDGSGTSVEDDWQVMAVGANSPIKTPQDLVGKTLGVNALGGVAEVFIKAGLDDQGIDPESVQLIEVPFPEVPAALSAGRIDAGFATEPFLTSVLDAGGSIPFAPQSQLAPNNPNGSYTASEQYVGENGDVVERFRRAMNKSADYAQEHQDEVRAIIPTYTKIAPEVAERIRLPYFTSELEEDLIDTQMGYLEEYGIAEDVPAAADLFC